MHVRWFGDEPWGAVCDPAYKIPVPLGKCIDCTEKITERDRGVVTACSPRIWGAWALEVDGVYYNVCSYHLKCFLSQVVGGEMSGRVAERMLGAAAPVPVENMLDEDDLAVAEMEQGEEDAERGGGW